MTDKDWRGDVLKFWFALDDSQWWRGGEELDHRIKQNFAKLWWEKRQLPVEQFTTDPLTALAAVILFDPIFQGLAISLLFGLASSTLLTVLVIPAIYVVLRDDGRPPGGLPQPAPALD